MSLSLSLVAALVISGAVLTTIVVVLDEDEAADACKELRTRREALEGLEGPDGVATKREPVIEVRKVGDGSGWFLVVTSAFDVAVGNDAILEQRPTTTSKEDDTATSSPMRHGGRITAVNAA